MIRTLRTVEECRSFQKELKSKKQTVGFVPTMGALHQGHLNLVKKAKSECDAVIVSIFVNPTQFNDPKDLEKYPRDLNSDVRLLESVDTDAVFFPEPEMIYTDGYRFKLTETEFSRRLCGAHRPGHFDGVLTVVMKLFQIVSPSKAYFGEKDYQQLKLIQDMVSAFFLDITIVPVETTREADGLAMSSRNLRLSEVERAKAPRLYEVIKTAKSDTQAIELLVASGFKVDYVETVNGRRYAAAFLGQVRLIDNVRI
jgi:pantoate--beta-alanine ligase